MIFDGPRCLDGRVRVGSWLSSVSGLLIQRILDAYMMERTKRLRMMTNSTSGGKSPELTTRRLVRARGSDGHGAMLNLIVVISPVIPTYAKSKATFLVLIPSIHLASQSQEQGNPFEAAEPVLAVVDTPLSPRIHHYSPHLLSIATRPEQLVLWAFRTQHSLRGRRAPAQGFFSEEDRAVVRVVKRRVETNCPRGVVHKERPDHLAPLDGPPAPKDHYA